MPTHGKKSKCSESVCSGPNSNSSAYNRFAKTEHKKVSEVNFGMAPKEVAKEINGRWKEASSNVKAKLQTQTKK